MTDEGEEVDRQKSGKAGVRKGLACPLNTNLARSTGATKSRTVELKPEEADQPHEKKKTDGAEDGVPDEAVVKSGRFHR